MRKRTTFPLPVRQVAAAFALLAIVALSISMPDQAGLAVSAGEQCSSVPDVITHGPGVGAVTQDTAKLWIRSCQPVAVAAQVKLASESWSGGQIQQTPSISTDLSSDYTGVIPVSGLDPDTLYDYRILVEDQLPGTPLQGQLRTMPQEGSGARFSFIAASDLHHPWPPTPDAALANMQQQHANFAVLMGDQITIETVLFGLGRWWKESQADYELAYRNFRAYSPFRDFVASTPTYMIWDDHEIYNDWDNGLNPPVYPWARAAYEEYVNSANPAPRTTSGVNYTFKAGDVAFYVLDTRSYRSPGEAPDGLDKTMLGLAQKEDLKAWLLSSPAKFKFIVSSVMWNDFSRHVTFGESWPAYRTERDEIFNFIRDKAIRGVVLLSGDEHWSGVFRLSPWNLYEIAPGPLAWGVSATESEDPQILFKRSGGGVFGVFAVDTLACPASLAVRIIDSNNQVPLSLPLTESDLGYDVDGDRLAPCQEEALGTDPRVGDTDRDGCADGEEVGGNAGLGGQRDPLNFWDFFDTDTENRPNAGTHLAGAVSVGDIVRVLMHFGQVGNAGIDPLSNASSMTTYHTRFDRTVLGPNVWNLGPPDGAVSVGDIVAMVNQYGHNCLTPP